MTKRPLPLDSWDCHFHVFENSLIYPFAANRAYTPARSGIEAYWATLASLGVSHAVLIQPSVYGFDNSLLLDLLNSDASRLRGVAVVPTDTDVNALSLLRASGVRGIRLNSRLSSGLSLADGIVLAPKLSRAGLHLELQPSFGDFEKLGDYLGLIDVPLVLDHMGLPDLTGPDGQGMQDTLLRLLEHDRFWLKISGLYKFGVPLGDARIVDYARALTSARPDRMLFGSDCPHPEHDLTVEDTLVVAGSLPGLFTDASAFYAACCVNPLEIYA